MDQKAFESYLSQTKRLAPEPLQQLIAAHKSEHGDKTYLAEFFAGEEAFHQARYEKALKHYLKAGGVPLHPFFCFRASALLFQSMNNPEKAEEFALKALTLDPDDPHLHGFRKNDPILNPGSENSITEPVASPKEIEMHTESDIFSSPHTRSVEKGHALTERLYPDTQNGPWLDLEKADSEKVDLGKIDLSPFEQKDPWQELKKMASSDPLFAEDPLEQAIKAVQREQATQMGDYLRQRETRGVNGENELFCFTGWSGVPSSLWLSSHNWQGSGGFFIRWRGEGVVLNPGRSFLERFHAQGLHLRDIDRVIITNPTVEIYAGVEQLYRLNAKLNSLAHDVHLLHYYLQREAFQNLSPILKPQFKQERNNLHCLELFMDSPDVERVDIAPQLSLHYFPVQGSQIGIRLDLKGEKQTVKVGYIAGGAWNPLLSHHLGTCDILIAAFGKTQLNDCHQIAYNSDSLGYNGCATLSQEVAPRLMLCGEFDGSEGDIRLPAIQKLRASVGGTNRTLLPAENGLRLCLSNWAIQCNLSGSWVNPQKIKVVQTESAFAPLKYLAPNCCF